MRKVTTMGTLAMVLLAGCGSGDTVTTAAASLTAQATAPAGALPTSAATASTSGSTSGAAGAVLTGTVGTKDDPDAFVITLTDSSGQPVTTVPAGTYTLDVKDPSKIHNFHLKGGGVDETTTVPEVIDTRFQVTLAPGTYTYICDPHPRMVGSLTVT